MRPDIATHDALARLLEYPRESFADAVEKAARQVADSNADAGAMLEPFVAFARSEPLSTLEETFTRTFDNSAERALEVGWHTFGENYTRGTFMVRMRQRMREVGVEENGELPDHLSHVMAVLGRADARWSGDMAHDTVAPAVAKIHTALIDQQNPWASVLAAVAAVLAMHEHSPRPPEDEPESKSEWAPPHSMAHDSCHGCGPREEFGHE